MSVFPGGGGMGVAFFFVLGGFSMTLGYRDRVLNPSFRYGNYFVRRAVKFYPLHWLCLLLSLPLAYESFSWLTLGANAVLLHSWIPKGSFFFSYNAVSWYLADTLFFAVVFPFLIRGIGRMGWKLRLMGGLLLALIYLALAIFVPGDSRHTVLYIFPLVRLFDFIVGIIAALLFLRMKESPGVQSFVNRRGSFIRVAVWASIALMVCLAFFLSGKMHSVAAFYWPLIMVVILGASLVSCAGKKWLLTNRWTVRFGELSFPFFLLHQLLIRYVYLFIRPSLCLLTDNRYLLQLMLVVVCFIVTLTVTILIQSFFNKPVTQWLTKRIRPSLTARS